jgi:hypothetical protein
MQFSPQEPRSVDVNVRPAAGQDSPKLRHRGQLFINFTNGTFQWIDVQRFDLTASVDDWDALALLIRDERYGCDYAGGDPGQDSDRHGPYWRERITPDAFDPTDVDTEERRLRGWAEQYAELTSSLRSDVEAALYAPLRAAGHVYRLRDLGEIAFHDWGGVHGCFHELVLIDRTAGTLTLVVAADD